MLTKDQINDAANILANLIVNEEEVHEMIHRAVCQEMEIDPDVDHSATFESNESFESRYYQIGAKYWSAITIRAAVQLDGLTND